MSAEGPLINLEKITGENICSHGHLAGYRHVTPEKPHEEPSDWSLVGPLIALIGERGEHSMPRSRNSQRIEDQLVTSVSIFFPASQLIVNCKRYAFLESTIVVSSKPYDPALHLQTKTDVKILGDVSIRPPFGLAIGRINECNALNSLPT